MNHLQTEKSPYLLQHVNNPVDWYPWGEAAFEKAKKEDKPIFLSIGYSTCHWCHVMAHESFEDLQVAELLNQNFVSIKIDREERPDIDTVYMSVCQAVTGSGGWPLTIIMTPDQKPFFAGTYLPKHTRYGSTGLIELLEIITERWNNDRNHLLKAGNEIVTFLNQDKKTKKNEPSKSLLELAVKQYKNSFDSQWGGFGRAPKFPSPHNLLFLLRYSILQGDSKALEMVEQTLIAMARGGIFDHVGGGFSRYSTDQKWLTPHFEKMLYDNALLAIVYLQTYQITKRQFYRNTATRTLDYILSELTDDLGGFYCGQDADSDGEEGKYYVFTPQEVQSVLGKEDGKLFCKKYDITQKGNFEGKSIPNLIAAPDWEHEDSAVGMMQKKLNEYRKKRTKLHKDDKVLTSWNGLTIAAMSLASVILNNPKYLSAAQKAQKFIEENLSGTDDRLSIRWRDGQAAYTGQLDDYAFYAYALITLYETTLNLKYLRLAILRAKQILKYFEDVLNGGCFLYAADAEKLITRPKESYDGAIPSGNSMAGYVFARLALLTGEKSWIEASERQLRFLAGELTHYPAGYGFALTAFLEILYPAREIVCCTNDEKDRGVFLNWLYSNSHLNLSTLFKTAENMQELSELVPFTSDYPLPSEGFVYYLCQNGSCNAPVNSLEELSKLLNQ